MNSNIRVFGLKIIDKLGWGSHICHLYSSKEEYFQVIVPYIKSGLENNELCLWVYFQNTNYEEIKSALDNSIENIDGYIEKGQLLIIPYTDWYLEDDTFIEVRVNSLWKKHIKLSLDKGFDGLSAAADTSWAIKNYFRSFLSYEENINDLIYEKPFIALCLYDANRLDPFKIADVIRNHTYTIVKHNNKLELIENVELLIKDRQLEEKKERINDLINFDKKKSELIINMSHEFRTPLNVILGATQLMKSDLELSSNYDYKSKCLKTMERNCLRLVRLVNNIIDITKIDFDNFHIDKRNCDIVNLVEGATLAVADYAKSKDIRVTFDTNTEEKIIACDSDQIERMLLNLLSNAIKFTQNGGSILVKIFDSGDKIRIIVKDDGIGIPKDKQKSIFNKFEQVDNSLARKNEGSGIGLTLVKAIVEKHKGRILLDSELGKGSKFIVELPCELVKGIDYRSGHKLDKCISNTDKHIDKANLELADIYS